MQETWTFDFPTSKTPKEGLESLLIEKEKDLGIFLSYYYKKEGAVAEKVKLKSDLIFKTESTGSFVLEFDLVHFNACLAIHDQVREKMKLTFEIDSQLEKVKLIGAYWPSREMDEI